MTQPIPFRPETAATVSIAATSTTARVNVQVSPATNHCVRVYNAGPNDAFIEFGDSTVTASTTTSMPIPVKGVEVLTARASYAAAICAATNTATVYFTPGEGL